MILLDVGYFVEPIAEVVSKSIIKLLEIERARNQMYAVPRRHGKDDFLCIARILLLM